MVPYPMESHQLDRGLEMKEWETFSFVIYSNSLVLRDLFGILN